MDQPFVVWPSTQPNVTCSRCRHRHPPDVPCQVAADLAAKARKVREANIEAYRAELAAERALDDAADNAAGGY